MIPIFVPADRPERYAKATSSADVAILDLEDAVAPERKSLARVAVAAALRSASPYWIRINALGSDGGTADISMLESEPRPEVLMLAKTGSACEVRQLARRLPGTRIFALIESIAGLVNLEHIALEPELSGLAFGAYNLCAELGARVTAEVLAPWRAQIVLTARRFELECIDTPFVDLSDPGALWEDARRGADFGFDGKFAIHPKQVPIIRTAFLPSDSEVARAQRISEQFINGVTLIDGCMIDAPMIALARQTLERARKGSK